MKVYCYHTDPGHGWIAVKRSELIRLSIADKITPYSYQRGEIVYLEEDQDATTWSVAKDASGEDYAIRESHCVRSPIRSYQSYLR